AKIGKALPHSRLKAFVDHTYEEMVCQRVGQIMCGYEDANDCDCLRHDSVLKLAVGSKTSDKALSSQPTMTRMENGISKETLFVIAYLFLDHFIASYENAHRRFIIDADDTNANTYGAKELSLFNDYYGEYCFIPLLLMEGYTGKMILPILRPCRLNKSLNVHGILPRVIEYLHSVWPRTIFMLRGDCHFCSHDFMDWEH
ncbi:transposase, partial [Sinorhizobium sp. GL28]|uniref:transposase n=1 Tax=Sinorhizobium sp. GL28 TaxID=1358418 RepID=UPI000725ACBA